MSESVTLEGEYVDVQPIDETTDELSSLSTSPTDHEAGRVSEPSSTPEWLGLVREQLSAIGTLNAGWNSYYAAPPNPRTLRNAEALIVAIAQATENVSKPHVNPTPNGVQFEWEDNHRYFEIELIDPRIAEYYYEDQAGVSEEGKIYIGEPINAVVKYVKHFLGEALSP